MSQQLIEALQNPSLYEHPSSAFEVVETHISWVILSGSYAYKIKKPMDFGFLNFTELAQRKRFCEAEMKLNQRLAPELYEAVLPIYGSAEKPSFTAQGDNDEPFEYTIRMRQFPSGQLLSQLQERGELNMGHIDALGSQIAQFHRSIDRAEDCSRFGQAEQVMLPVQQNFDQTRPMLSAAALGSDADIKQLDRLEAWAQESFARLSDKINQRKKSGYIRACHGDIHLGNVTLFNDEVTLFDCIEFNEDFRWTDTCADIAFLVMDLEARGETHFANHFLNAYLQSSGDYDLLPLLNFYKAYRAMVRAKVSLFMLQGADAQKQEEIFCEYRAYADLAESYTQIPCRYMLITHGLSGSGKTTVSNRLIDDLEVIRVRSDVERKRIFNLRPDDDSQSALNDNIYTGSATEQTYARLRDLSTQILASGYSVVVDACFLRKDQRDLLKRCAEDQATPFLIINCEADEATIRTWIKQRRDAGDDASEADIAVFEQQLRSQEVLSANEQAYSKQVKTDDQSSVSSLVERINQRLCLNA